MEIRNKRKVSITLDNSVFDKLPKRDKSAYINLVLKQHYQKEAFDQLYEGLKKRLMGDQQMMDWVFNNSKASNSRYEDLPSI